MEGNWEDREATAEESGTIENVLAKLMAKAHAEVPADCQLPHECLKHLCHLF